MKLLTSVALLAEDPRMPPRERFVACPGCGCHAKSHEVDCPHCGARRRGKDGSVPRTAAAMLMGLAALSLPAAANTACSDGEGGSGGTMSSSSASGSGGAAGQGGATGSTGDGVGGAYGGPMDSDNDGYDDLSGDCNDNDPEIHPNAPEMSGDEIDSNCDGNNDT